MQQDYSRVLMVTPFNKMQRGNSLTTARLDTFLSERGFTIDRLSLEDEDWQGQIKYALKRTRYSLVHGFHGRHFALVLRAIPEMHRFPLLLTTTGTDLNYDLPGPDGNLVLEVFGLAQKIVVFHEDFFHDLCFRYPELCDKLVTIPQGVFLEAGLWRTRDELGLTADNVVFLLPSGLRAVKNIELAVEGLAAVHRKYPQVRLLIAGAKIDDDYSRRIMDSIHHLPWIKYVGEIPHEDMRGLLQLGDVVLNTSDSEGQPQGALEAMSLGRPAILTAVPGNRHIIEHGREGFYVNNAAELAGAAEILLTNPRLRQAMGEEARRLVEDRFTLDQEIDAYSDLYRQLGRLI